MRRQDKTSLVDFEAHLSGRTQFLLDAILGFINTEQNQVFKVLTIVSVVGIPPTLIAGMYGINFHNMPELLRAVVDLKVSPSHTTIRTHLLLRQNEAPAYSGVGDFP